MEVAVKDAAGKAVETFATKELTALPKSAITNNKYMEKVKVGARSLEVPLGSRAQVTLTPQTPTSIAPGQYKIELADVSGARWSVDVH